MTWNVNDSGFLPPQDPTETILIHRAKYLPLEATLENLSDTLPHLVENRQVREELVWQLRSVAHSYSETWLFDQCDAWAERVMMLYSYFASTMSSPDMKPPLPEFPRKSLSPLTPSPSGWVVRRYFPTPPMPSTTGGVLTPGSPSNSAISNSFKTSR